MVTLATKLRRITRVIPDPKGSWVLAPGGIARLNPLQDGLTKTELAQEDWQGLEEAGLLDPKFGSEYGVTLFTTTACNLRCHYCFQNENSGRIPSRRMSTRVIDAAAHFTRNKASLVGANEISLSLMGGEPTLAFSACIYALEKFNRDFAHVESHIVTNGTTLKSEEIDSLISAGLNSLQITLDGNRSEHDKVRRGSAISATYDRIIENLLDLSSRPELSLTIRVNVTAQNVASLGDMIDDISLLANNSRVFLHFAPVRNYPWNLESNEDTGSASLINTIKKAEGLGLNTVPPNVSACIHCTLPWGERGIVVGPNGLLYPNWTVAGREELSLGSVFTGYDTSKEPLWKGCQDYDAESEVTSHSLTGSEEFLRDHLRVLYENN